ncbi:hypothetical protein C3489_14220 [Streptomyces sp. Ru71]|nr:hypothetical protein C3489_14220 [Streptomyces sp. Ru71]
MNWGAQVLLALVLCGGLAGGLWYMGQSSGSGQAADKPASCSESDKKALTKPARARHVTGDQLCEALNRADLPALLGTPAEHAQTAYGSDSSVKSAGGTEIATPEATVDLTTYSVKLSASYDHMTVDQFAGLEGPRAERKTILGHRAVLYSDQTIKIGFNLGGGDATTAPGGIARTLVIAPDAKDSGGSYEVALWRQDGGLPDDAALLRVAEQVLPAVPGWNAP